MASGLLHLAVSQIANAETARLGKGRLSESAMAALVDLVEDFGAHMGSDLEHFAQHAKRKARVQSDDVMLFARKSAKAMDRLRRRLESGAERGTFSKVATAAAPPTAAKPRPSGSKREEEEEEERRSRNHNHSGMSMSMRGKDKIHPPSESRKDQQQVSRKRLIPDDDDDDDAVGNGGSYGQGRGHDFDVDLGVDDDDDVAFAL